LGQNLLARKAATPASWAPAQTSQPKPADAGGPKSSWLERGGGALQRATPAIGTGMSILSNIAQIGLSWVNTLLNLAVTAARDTEELAKKS
jgi:hypothetical protein